MSTARSEPARGVWARWEDLSSNPWDGGPPPVRILVIRFHAVGDVAITLPACTALRKLLPEAQIDYLTGHVCRELPGSLTIFDTVHVFPETRSRWDRGLQTLKMASRLTKLRYEMVIDLQRNWVTRAIRRSCLPPFWSEFDRFSPAPAGERVLESFWSAGFQDLAADYAMPVRAPLVAAARTRLLALGWDGISPLICLNPAGLWKTRNWPPEHYADLARLVLRQTKATFVLLGDERIAETGKFLAGAIPHAINLIGLTTLDEAFAVVQLLVGMVSDDSGLMHMAWNSGVPTLALLGSSRHDWSAPLGPHSRTLHSGDLECGACMKPECAFGDVHCLTRYTPETVLQSLLVLLGRGGVA